MSGKIHQYESEAITVQYDVQRCIHAAECVNRLRAVFDSGKRPWAQPQNASADAVAETISHCPSGALEYTRKDGGAPEAKPEENRMRLSTQGPLYVRGEIRIGDKSYYRVALCRCGASKNKPFCDNMHKDVHFQTDGLVSENRRKLNDIDGGGELQITPEPNGPYWVLGDFEIVDIHGEVVYSGSETWLCRCGGSSNKPFCDSTHNKIGFQAE